MEAAGIGAGVVLCGIGIGCWAALRGRASAEATQLKVVGDEEEKAALERRRQAELARQRLEQEEAARQARVLARLAGGGGGAPPPRAAGPPHGVPPLSGAGLSGSAYAGDAQSRRHTQPPQWGPPQSHQPGSPPGSGAGPAWGASGWGPPGGGSSSAGHIPQGSPQGSLPPTSPLQHGYRSEPLYNSHRTPQDQLIVSGAQSDRLLPGYGSPHRGGKQPSSKSPRSRGGSRVSHQSHGTRRHRHGDPSAAPSVSEQMSRSARYDRPSGDLLPGGHHSSRAAGGGGQPPPARSRRGSGSRAGSQLPGSGGDGGGAAPMPGMAPPAARPVRSPLAASEPGAHGGKGGAPSPPFQASARSVSADTAQHYGGARSQLYQSQQHHNAGSPGGNAAGRGQATPTGDMVGPRGRTGKVGKTASGPPGSPQSYTDQRRVGGSSESPRRRHPGPGTSLSGSHDPQRYTVSDAGDEVSMAEVSRMEEQAMALSAQRREFGADIQEQRNYIMRNIGSPRTPQPHSPPDQQPHRSQRRTSSRPPLDAGSC